MRTVREVSAGGVIHRLGNGQFEVALIRVGKRWRLPKGHPEKGERLEAAASREVREETGLEGKIISKLGDIHYWYRTKGETGEPVRIFKKVHFYLFRYLGGEVHSHDHEVDEARWFPIQEAIESLAFASERRMVRKALNLLNARARSAHFSPVRWSPPK
jgi:8-oxo-dGTP pyrophosphatase MutT (NUDIX family)